MVIRTLLLTGDTAPVAEAVAKQLNIAEVAADLLPEQKPQRVKALVDQGCTFAMVGDGVNDAPALIEANVLPSRAKVSTDAVKPPSAH